ncbi:MAG: hypothetical protein KKB97_10400, partial [Alphaproteobacteria bacterium]|nr:hypothetical protein [Alphaproteobacteria bacterium]
MAALRQQNCEDMAAVAGRIAFPCRGPWFLRAFRRRLSKFLKNSVLNQPLTEKFRSFKIRVLTCFAGWDYKPLTNEGGGAASDDVLRSREFQQDWRMLIWIRRRIEG